MRGPHSARRILAGGEKLIRLQYRPPDAGSRFTAVDVLPDRGFNVFQIRARLPGMRDVPLLFAPDLENAATRLNDDVLANCGGAVLAPYAHSPGLKPEHGLILNRKLERIVLGADPYRSTVQASMTTDALAGRQKGSISLEFKTELHYDGIRIGVSATNVGTDPVPAGLGWQPHFAVPSGERKRFRIKIPADSFRPSDAPSALPVGGSAYDFTQSRALNDLNIHGWYSDLRRDGGGVTRLELIDPGSQYGLRMAIEVSKAIHVHAPAGQPFLAVTPQHAPGETGLRTLEPGRSVFLRVWMVLFNPLGRQS